MASHGYDAIVYTVQPLPKLGPQDGVAQVTPAATNALAAVPATSAARSRPGQLLRTE